MKKRSWILIVLVVLFGAAGYFLPNAFASVTDDHVTLYIRVYGAVTSPAIVTMQKGGTIEDAIKKAGGLLPNADLSLIQFDKKLDSAQPVFIPSK
jgi:DNA uptake protein ComE-like DNA-binding protein